MKNATARLLPQHGTRCFHALCLLPVVAMAAMGVERVVASGNVDIQPTSLTINCTGTVAGGQAAANTPNGVDVAPQGSLDLSNPTAILGTVQADEIVIRFKATRAAALHAHRMTVAPHDRGQWLDDAASAGQKRLPAAIRGLRPGASGQAKALRTVNTHAGLGADAAVMAGGKALDIKRAPAVSGAVAQAFEAGDPMGVFHARVAPGTDVRRLCLELMKNPDVVYACPSPICQMMAAPNDPLYPRMWNLPLINLPEAWDISGNTLGAVRVCVVDSGVRITHLELAGRIADPVDIYLDNGDAFADADPNNDDPYGHGTACAGIIASIRGNGLLVAGVAPVTIIPVNGYYSDGVNTGVVNYPDGIYWGVDHGASVISLSIGGTHSDPYPEEVDAINYAQAHGVVVCAAAGNENGAAEQVYPGALPYCIQVGAVDNNGIRVRPPTWWWGSNYGSTLDVCAPGQGSVGLFDSILTLGRGADNSYVPNFNGTSAATPHVAGLAALLKHINPALTGDQIRKCIESTARDRVGAPEEDTPGRDPYHGYGLIDAAAAAQCAKEGGNCITISNNSSEPILVYAMQAPSWAHISPSAPFSIAAGGSQPVAVTACGQCAGSALDGTLTIYSSDPDAGAIPVTLHVDCESCQPLFNCQASPGAILPGQPTMLSATTGGSDTVEWFTESCGGNPVPGGATPTVSPTETTTYYARSKNAAAACVSSDCCAVQVLVISGDLSVSNLTGPTTSGAGQNVTFTVTTRNGTSSTPAGASTTRLYWSTDTTLDAADLEMGTCAVPALDSGQSNSCSVPATFAAELPAGTYYVIAKADADDAVVETNEANNTKTLTIKIGPDLSVSSMSGPSTSGAGQMVTLSATVKNGTNASPVEATTTRFYWSTDGKLDEGDAEMGQCAVPALAANESSPPCTLEVNIPPDFPPATYYVFAKADADDAVVETSETNNTRYKLLKVGADLSITALTAPSTSGSGQTISIGATVKNGSTSSPTGPFFTRAYWSCDSKLDPGDCEIGSRSSDGLEPGQTAEYEITLVIPADTSPGSYYIIARTDDGDAVVLETSESNNVKSRLIKIGSDLTVPALSAPSISGAGQNITITATVQNGSTASPTGAFFTRLYLSSNYTLDSGDTEIGSCGMNSLDPGQSTECQVTWSIPLHTAPATYYIIAKADADDTVPSETNETNNTKYFAIKVGADLSIPTLTAPSSGTAGQTITVSVTIQNGATASPSGAFLVRLYWSTNLLLDSSDSEIGNCTIANLGAGESTTCSFPARMPAVTSRAVYYLIAKADADGVLTETSESNNTKSRSILVNP